MTDLKRLLDAGAAITLKKACGGYLIEIAYPEIEFMKVTYVHYTTDLERILSDVKVTIIGKLKSTIAALYKETDDCIGRVTRIADLEAALKMMGGIN